jgi:hypothetical protein
MKNIVNSFIAEYTLIAKKKLKRNVLEEFDKLIEIWNKIRNVREIIN